MPRYLFFNSKVADSPESIFQKQLHSVVELHSSNDDGRESFGTATIVNGDGTLLSNAHLVLYKESGVYKEYPSIEGRSCDENDYCPLSLINYNHDKDTCTLSRVFGGYTNEEKDKVTVLVNYHDTKVLRAVVSEINPKAFITIDEVR